MKSSSTILPSLFLPALALFFGLAMEYASAPITAAEEPPVEVQAAYAGSETCTMCHDEAAVQLQQGAHGQATAAGKPDGAPGSCEGCHGPGAAHADDPSAETAASLLQAARDGTGCLSCHGTRISRVRWQGSAHAREQVTCTTCHGQQDQPHGDLIRTPGTESCLACHAEKRAEMAMPSHHPVMEGRIDCTDCHDPHRPMGEEVKRDVCVQCHAAQRGPYRYEHGAISGHLTDACLDCHRPHGSPNHRLLKLNNRGLCLQCHADQAGHAAGRRCWDCHSAPHGSNSSRLLFRM